MKLYFEKVHNLAVTPAKATAGSYGYDLSSVEELEIQPGEIAVISTGLVVRAPRGKEFQIRSRSGLSSKGVIVMNAPGTIDYDYDGVLKVILGNFGKLVHRIKPGDRIAQGVLSQVFNYEVEVVDVLTSALSERGSGGFGSTGI